MVDTIQGYEDHQTVLALLADQMATANPMLWEDAQNKKASQERQRVISETTNAYERSLASDRAKAEAAAQQAQREADVARAREAEAARLREEEAEALREEASKRESAARRVPEEPAADAAGVSTIQMRAPDGSKPSRRWLLDHTIQVQPHRHTV